MNAKKSSCGQAAVGRLFFMVLACWCFPFVGCTPPPTPPVYTPADAIPGLQPVDVLQNLNQEFIRTGPQKLGDRFYWKCSFKTYKNELTVNIASSSVSSVCNIEAVAVNFSGLDAGEIASDFFGSVATLDYDGSSPSDAREWVVANINNTASKTIGPVTFKITTNSSSPLVRTLLITR